MDVHVCLQSARCARTYDLQCVDEACSRNDGGAVLIIVEHGDAHAALRLTLNIEALRRLQVCVDNVTSLTDACRDILWLPE
jgi:hypothetical protein